MKKLTRILSVLCLLVAVSGAVSAASLKDIIKIGVVDVEKLFKEYATRSKAARDLQLKRQQYAKEVNIKKKDIQKLEQQFLKEKAGLSSTEVMRRQMEIDFQKSQLLQLIDKRNKQLADEERKLTAPIQKEIYSAIRSVAQTQGIKIVLDSRNYVAYYDYTLDLTELVQNRLRYILYRKGQY